MFLSVGLLLFGLLNGSQSLLYNKSADLMTDVLSGYNSRLRPLQEQYDTLNVSVSFYVSSIRELNEVEEKFSIGGFVSMSWQDEIINWTPSDYGGALKIDLKLSDIWYPKLVLVNPYSKMADLGEDWMMLSVTYAGNTIFKPVTIFESSCSVDVTYYPYDTQECSLVFAVMTYTGNEVTLTPSNNVQVSDFAQNGQWTLETTSVTWVPGGSHSSDTLLLTFKVKRKSLFLVINIILPIIFMAVINILVFILPAESGERLSFSVTVLLALAVYLTLVGENLPKSSEPMSILSYYLLGTLLISTLITVVTIFNLGIYHRQCEVTQCYGSLARKILFKSCQCKDRNNLVNVKVAFAADEKEKSIGSLERDKTREITWQEVSYAVDRICLILFSFASLLVNTVFLILLKYNL